MKDISHLYTIEDNLDSFFRIIAGKEKMLTYKSRVNYEVNFFAMSLLIPKEALLEIINRCGNVENIIKSKMLTTAIATKFGVENKVLIARIYDLIVSGEIGLNDNNSRLKMQKILIKERY